MYNVVREIKITGTEAYNVKSLDVVKIMINDKEEFKYQVPDGRNGTLSITLNGTLTD